MNIRPTLRDLIEHFDPGQFRWTCIPEHNICDGIRNCPNATDEQGCCQWTTWGQWIERNIFMSEEVS